MTPRDWFCLALRVVGVWQLATVVPNLFYLTLDAAGLASVGGLNLFYAAITTGGPSVIGVALVMFAPAIATRLYPNPGPPITQVSDEFPRRLLETGLLLLGVWQMVNAARVLLYALTRSLQTAIYSGASWRDLWLTTYLDDFILFAIYAAMGAVLLMRTRRIIEALDRLQSRAERDPDSEALVTGAEPEERAS